MELLMILSFGLIGALLALIDRMEDEGDKKNDFEPLALAIIASFLMGYLINSDFGSSIIFSAILLGVVLGGKVDNLSWLIGLVISSGAILARALYGDFLSYAILPFALGMAGFLDEYGHDRAKTIQSGLMRWFFEKRFTLKLAVFIVAFLGVISPYHFIAFLCFEIGYEFISQKRQL